MKKRLVLVIVIFLLFGIPISCDSDSMKFDASRWKAIENGLYGQHVRKKMLDDLIRNYLKFGEENGTNRKEVFQLIGRPDFIDPCDSRVAVYLVQEKIGKIDPVGYTYLKLTYNKSALLTSWAIEETSFRE